MKTIMNNPINNQVFDTRDLIEYLDSISTELVDIWNDMADEDHQASDINDIFGTSGYEFADDVKDTFANFEEVNEDDIEEYKRLNGFCDDLSGAPDYQYGEGVIHEDYFTDYCKEMLEDCGYIPKDFPTWIELDFEATAENMKADYFSADYDGSTYFIRA